MTDLSLEAIVAKLRQRAREDLASLDRSVREFITSLPEGEQRELSAWVCEGRRLLHGAEAPPANGERVKNVRRLFTVGKSGPAFRETVFEIAAGGAAIKCARSTADEFAAEEDLPLAGPDIGGES